MAADHHYFEGLSIRNTYVAFLAGNKNIAGSSGLTVKRDTGSSDLTTAIRTFSFTTHQLRATVSSRSQRERKYSLKWLKAPRDSRLKTF